MQNNKSKLGNVATALVSNIAKTVESVDIKADINIRNIPLSEIKLNSKNNFGMRDIEKLAESIKEHGQQHNAVVNVLHDDPQYKYIMVSGERRLRAIELNGGSSILAKIVDVDDLQAEALMIILNLETRVPNDMELSNNATRLAEIVKTQKKDGQHKGLRTNEVVATMLTTENSKVDTAKVTKLLTIQNLIPEFKKLMESEELSLEKANQFAQMPKEQQKFVYDYLEQGKELSAKQARQLKDQLNKEKDEAVENVIKSKAEELDKAREETQDYKKLADKAQGEINKIVSEKNALQGEFDETKKTLDKLQKEIDKSKEELDKKIDALKVRLQEEIKKDLDEQNEETISKLKADLKQVQEQEKKLANDYKEKLDKLQKEQEENKKQLQLKIQEQETIEANKAIQSLGRQAQKALSVLMEEINKALKIPNFELTEDTKAIITEVSKFDGSM